ncbi:MAG: S-layer homology domain-containing protein [Clostridia bacterium]|nr:S-layer homology domain-containing protein [Clostridia bacterium]
MKIQKRLFAVLLTVSMNLPMISPVFSTETEEIDLSGMTVQEAVREVLENCGLESEQLGSYPYDYNAFAESLGLIDDNEDQDALNAAVTEVQIAEMLDIREQIQNAVEDGVPLFLNGKAQPIFPYTSGAVTEGYSNEDSDIIRYFVYVETNYDTDDDGKLDMVKALVQVPRSAVEGNYKASVIYEARPYITGTVYGAIQNNNSPGYDMSKLDSQPAPRVPSQEEPISTMEHAKNADSSEWYYQVPQSKDYWYEDLTWYDYYLVRGFAVVECGGIGTLDSEGFETCGDYHEVDAYKCVIEWLHGDRIAYTDKDASIPIEAEWCSGKIGMTGRSYAGTTQFALAATGVEGLETIVPVAGIANWYEYPNSQGICTGSIDYLDFLAEYCSGRYYDKKDWNRIQEKYSDYLFQLEQDQIALNGDYGETWAIRNYTLNAENIQCPALIVHGFADYNVRPKHFELMYNAYKNAGAEVKLLLHQDGHHTPTHPADEFGFEINGEVYDELLNKWFSHYLYDLDNGIENMAEVTAQDSHENTWVSYSSWESFETLTMTGLEQQEGETVSLSSDYGAFNVSQANWTDKFILDGGTPEVSAMYTIDIPEDTIIKGSVPVHFRASVSNAKGAEMPLGERDALMVSAMLVEIPASGKQVQSFFLNTMMASTYAEQKLLRKGGLWQGGGLKNYDLVELVATNRKYMIISRGWMDLCNPGAGYETSSAIEKISLEEGVYYDYTLYLQPNAYRVQEGNQLALIFYSYEPFSGMQFLGTNDYIITLDVTSVAAEIPVSAPVSDLEIKTGDGGKVNSSVTTPRVENGTTVTVEAVPDAGCRFAYWMINGEIAAETVKAEFEIAGDTVIEAVFAVDPIAVFTDVEADSWYEDAVRYVVENGIMSGTSDETFAPSGTFTRAEAIVMLYQMEGEPEVSAKNPFRDVADGEVYTDAVIWAASKGIVKGMRWKKFAPDLPITREQLVTVLYRYAQISGKSVSADLKNFGDAKSVSRYAVDAMKWAVGAGIIKGMYGELVPQGAATRAQTATVIMRLKLE